MEWLSERKKCGMLMECEAREQEIVVLQRGYVHIERNF